MAKYSTYSWHFARITYIAENVSTAWLVELLQENDCCKAPIRSFPLNRSGRFKAVSWTVRVRIRNDGIRRCCHRTLK